MAQILLILICLLAGYLLVKTGLAEASSSRIINIIVLHIALPALTLIYIPRIEINPSLLFPVITPWLNILLAWLVFGFIGKRAGWSKPLTGAMIMMTGFGNTSFVGIPVIQALYGEKGIETVIMVDQPGSFVALTTLGILISGIYSGKSSGMGSELFIKILKFPPFIAFVAGILMNIMDIYWSESLLNLLQYFGNLVVPLALISVGMQWKLDLHSKHWKFVWSGLAFKLIAFPFFLILMFVFLLGQRGEVIEISILEGAMAPMVTAGIIASSYGLKPRFCSMMLGAGIPLSFLTLGLIYLILQII